MQRILLILWACVSISNGFAKSQSLDSVLAEVNDAVITESELSKQIVDAQQQLKIRNLPIPDASALRKQVFEHLVDLTIQLQFAKNNNMSLEDDELNDIIKGIATQNHLSFEQMQTEVEKAGMSWSDYRQNLRKEVIISRLQQGAVGRDIHISEHQVDSYMKDARKEFNTKRKYHLLNIVFFEKLVLDPIEEFQ
jgi:peptidyl-prolyl cis-trans isomerase SurA